MILMQISMYTTYALEQDFPDYPAALRHFYERGVRFGDMLDVEPIKLPLHLYCEYMRGAGLAPNSYVSTADLASLDESRRAWNFAAVKGCIDQLSRLQVPYIMLAPAVRPATCRAEWERMQALLIEGFAAMVDYAKGSGVTVCMENQSSVTRADSKMQDVRYILDCVPGLGYVLDAGNFFCVAEDSLAAYELLKERMVHVHFKDWAFDPYGSGVRENMPRFAGVALGRGELPLRQLIGRMRRDGYKGCLMVEINSPKALNLAIVEESVDFLRRELCV